MSELPTLDGYGETYASYGFMFVGNASDGTANDIKNLFNSNAIDFCHELHGDIGSVWLKLGYDYYIPFNVLFDRDGMVRYVGGAATSAVWETTIKECCGAI